MQKSLRDWLSGKKKKERKILDLVNSHQIFELDGYAGIRGVAVVKVIATSMNNIVPLVHCIILSTPDDPELNLPSEPVLIPIRFLRGIGNTGKENDV